MFLTFYLAPSAEAACTCHSARHLLGPLPSTVGLDSARADVGPSPAPAPPQAPRPPASQHGCSGRLAGSGPTGPSGRPSQAGGPSLGPVWAWTTRRTPPARSVTPTTSKGPGPSQSNRP